MSRKLEGKVAVITGGTTGIGLATARLFAAEGARVFVTGRRQAELDKAVAAIGADLTGVRGDAANLADLDHLVETVRDQAGRIDVLFVNAGAYEFVPLEAVSEEHFDKLFNLNVKSVLFTVQKALPLMADGGAIVLTGSVSGSIGMAADSVYGATKAAIRSFARTWTAELKGRRIRVNVVSPGPIATPGLDSFADDATKAQLTALVPLGRIGEADEIAKATLFLASDDASFVAGAELFVDGGLAQV
jgi:NAD(P)-dependent dehydrogenase (short-subunit alcohol dehydrogenase family)